MTMLTPTSRMVARNSTVSDFSFLAISSKAGPDFLRKHSRNSNYDRHERSAVISRRRVEAPASQAGAAWVPSSQSSTAQPTDDSSQLMADLLHLVLEPPSAFCIVPKHVEAGARRRQEHDA